MTFDFLNSPLGFFIASSIVIFILFLSFRFLSRRLFFPGQRIGAPEVPPAGGGEIIRKAEEEALRITEDSHKQASEILQHATALNDRVEKELTHALEERIRTETARLSELTQRLVGQFESSFSETKIYLAGEIQKMSSVYAGKVREDVDKILHELEDEAKKNRDAVIRSLEEIRVETQQEIASYIEIRKNYSSELQKMYASIVQESRGGIDGFLRKLDEEIQSRDKTLADLFRELTSAAEKEVAEYKASRFQRVDDAIFRIVMFVSREVLGKTLSPEDHQELIIRALEDAKREGFFTVENKK